MVDLEIEDLFVKETQVLGSIDRSKILETFSDYDWERMYRKLDGGSSEQFFQTATMYFKDRENNMEISFSLIGKSKE